MYTVFAAPKSAQALLEETPNHIRSIPNHPEINSHYSFRTLASPKHVIPPSSSSTSDSFSEASSVASSSPDSDASDSPLCLLSLCPRAEFRLIP